MCCDHWRGERTAIMNDLFSAVGNHNLFPELLLFAGGIVKQESCVAEKCFSSVAQPRREVTVKKDVVRRPVDESAVPMKRHGAIGVKVVPRFLVDHQVVHRSKIPLQ